MKKFLCALLCLVITALSIAAPVMAAEEDGWMMIVSELFTEEIESTSLEGEAGTIRTTSMAGNLLYMRLRWFIQRFDCGIYLSLWNSLDNNPNYETIEDVCEDVLKNPEDDTLYIFYVKDTNEVSLHREGIFEDRMIASDAQYIAELITSSEVENDYYRFINVLNELWRIFGEAPTITYHSLAGTVDIFNDEIDEIMEPIREKFDGHIQVECWCMDDEEFISTWNNLNEEYQYLSYFEDSIYICYNGSSGTAIVNIGSKTGLSVEDLAAVQAAFEPAENDSDYSGFAAGIAALNKAIPSDPISTTTIIIIALAVVLVLAGIVYVIIKKKNSIPSKLG